MNNVNEKLLYGVKEDTDKRYLYVSKIIISNYKDSKQVKDLMSLLGSKWSFFQYNNNGKKAVDCDYFFWQYVPLDDKTMTWDDDSANWQSVEISVYKNSIDYDYKMRRLIDYINNNVGGVYVDIDVFYGDVRDLISKIDSDVKFEKQLTF